MQGAHQEAVDSAEHALRLSPRDRTVGNYASLAMANVHFTAGRYPECVIWARNMIEKSPENVPGHSFLTAALAMEGDLTAAAEARETLLRLRPELLAGLDDGEPPRTPGSWPSACARACARPGCRRHDRRPPPLRRRCVKVRYQSMGITSRENRKAAFPPNSAPRPPGRCLQEADSEKVTGAVIADEALRSWVPGPQTCARLKFDLLREC